MTTLLSSLAILLLGQQGGPEIQVARDCLPNGDGAYVLLPPEVVAGREVRSAKFSADGSYVYAIRHRQEYDSAAVAGLLTTGRRAEGEEKGEDTLVIWNVRTKRASDLLTVKLGKGAGLSYLAPFGRGSNALVQETVPKRSDNGIDAHFVRVYLVTPSKVTLLETSPLAAVIFFSLAPGQGLATVVQQIEGFDFATKKAHPVTNRYYNDAGRMLGEMTFRPELFPIPYWGEDGLPYYRTSGGGKTKPIDWYSYRVGQADVQRYQGEPRVFEEKKSILELRSGRMTGETSAANAEVTALWLRDPASKAEALVGTETEWVTEVSPTLNAVLYTSRGVALVRPLHRISKAEYEEGLAEVERQRLLRQVKSVGIGLFLWAGDHDDVLPPKDLNLAEALSKYVKNPADFVGFVYTFQGGHILKIKDITTTVCGYIEGPGGRAVLYGDGHATWVKNKP